MKIVEQAGSNVISPPGAQSQAQMSTREKAIAALMGGKQTQNVDAVNKAEIPNPSIPKAELAPQAEVAAEPAQNNNNEPSSEQVDASAPEVTEQKAPETKVDPATEQYQKLAKREQMLRRREAELRSKETAHAKALEEAKKFAEVDYSKYIPKDKLLSDPLSALAEQGLTYDQLTELAMKSPKTPEQIQQDQYLKTLESKISALESKLEQGSKQAVEQQEASYQNALKQLKTETHNLVKSQPDEFELVSATNSYSDVVELIEKVYKSDGILLSVEEAARDVENYLLAEAEKLSRLKKIQGRMNKSAAASLSSPAAPAKSVAPASVEAPVKNLTNTNSVSSRQLSRRERAILAAEGKLK